MLARHHYSGKQLIDMAVGKRLGIVGDPADQLIADDMKNKASCFLQGAFFFWASRIAGSE
ncbi:hypothetical protein Bra471DRAFT_05246 [Bradyrhizobium sp. WSM471]|nr:hypothetical protein Bra471DRAFT_05246 [Bradyrhizobium sp. WSM471]